MTPFRHWKINRCQDCGHSASHQKCAEAEGKHFSLFKCDDCINLEFQNRFRQKIDQETKSCAVSLTDIRASIIEGKIPSSEARSASSYVIQPQDRDFTPGRLCHVIEYGKIGRPNSNREPHGKRTMNEDLPLSIRMMDSVQDAATKTPLRLSSELGSFKGSHNHSSFSLSDKRSEATKIQCALYKYIENALKTNV